MTPAMTRLFALAAAFALTGLAAPASAGPREHKDRPHRHDPAQREEMLQKLHTMKVVELGQILELDTAGTVKLAARLKPFDEQRTKLRLESYEAMKVVRQARRGETSGDVVAATRSLAQSRVKLAQLDERELDAVLEGLSGEKAAKAALFMIRFPRRIEKMAGKMHDRRERSDKDSEKDDD